MALDLANRRLFHVPVRGRKATLSTIEGLLDLRLEERDGKVLLERRDARNYDQVTGAELLEFSGRQTGEWLSLLENPGSKRLDLIRELHAHAKTHPKVLRLKDGRIVHFEVDEPPPERGLQPAFGLRTSVRPRTS